MRGGVGSATGPAAPGGGFIALSQTCSLDFGDRNGGPERNRKTEGGRGKRGKERKGEKSSA